MRYQGRITAWKDDQGFGFVTPNGGGKPVFLHIKSFSSRQRRPVGNEIVTYELTTDERQRPRAVNVSFVGERRIVSASTRRGPGVLVFAVLFLAMVAVAVVMGKLSAMVLGIYVVASIVTLMAYASDKTAAEDGASRVQEEVLHVLALVGGWPGALLAQRGFRHKTSKRTFQSVFWVTVALNCGALLFYYFFQGSV